MNTISRRRFLRGSGAAIALPFLESVPFAPSVFAASGQTALPKRLICIGVALGMHPESWVPEKSGSNYPLSRLLKPLAEVKNDFSIISGLDHPAVNGGHKGVPAFLSGVYKPVRVGKAIVIHNTITLDQAVAQVIGKTTRYQSLQLSVASDSGDSQLSWNEKGVYLQPEVNARRVFEKLFVSTKNPKQKKRILDARTSVLDLVMDDAKILAGQVSHDDVARMDQYMDTVRDVEKRVQKQLAWLNQPKPKVKAPSLHASTFHENMDLLFELTALAIQTDSTRVISFDIPSGGLPFETAGVSSNNYHALSHHGRAPDRLEKLVQLETEHMRSMAKFIQRLKNTPDGNGTLLDNTNILFGSGLGNGSSHSSRRLPILVAGGAMKHGQHLAFDRDYPLCNLFVTLMQQSGVEIENFSDSNGNMNELFA